MEYLTKDHVEINKIVKDIRFVMVTFTTEEGHLHSVPMTTQNTDFNGIVWFIGSKKSELVKIFKIIHRSTLATAISRIMTIYP